MLRLPGAGATATRRSPLASRGRWLGHPLFLACVAVLALNDHVFKSRFPGWWTGKLSDLAGVAVVATLAAVAVGPRRGVLLAAVGFAALKTVPGVAELARPVLGGTTRRDPGDLLALVVLVPVWLILVRADARPPPARAPGSSAGFARIRASARRLRAALAAAAPVIGACTAVLTATATSCGPGSSVVKVVAGDGVVYALVHRGSRDPTWAASVDGGRTWERFSSNRYLALADETFEDTARAGPTTACTADGTCFHVDYGDRIERRGPDGRWVTELELTSEDREDASAGCTGGYRGILGSVTVTDSGTVVASFGGGGVVVREDGVWKRFRVLHAPPPEATGPYRVLFLVMLASGPVLALGVWLVQKRRRRAIGNGVVMLLGAWVAMLAGTTTGGSFVEPGRARVTLLMGQASLLGLQVIVAAAVVALVLPPRPAAGGVPTSAVPTSAGAPPADR